MTDVYHQCVTTVEVGRPSSSGERWQSFKILFHRFADLPSAVDQSTLSPEFTCNGHRWRLIMYPGGDSQARRGNLSIHLGHCSGARAKASFEVSVLGKSQDIHMLTDRKTDRNFVSDKKTWGWSDYGDGYYIYNKCLDDDGTLAVKISIKTDSASSFVPSNPMAGMITGMFLDEETADVCFEVSSKEVHAFYANSFILKACAPMLASLFGSDDENGKIATVSITDVEPTIFRHLLHYVYGGSVPDEVIETHAKDIIDAADKYSIVNLKLEVEAAYVESTEITMGNAIDNLLYADSKNCAFLKEVVMDFLAENSVSASQTLSFTDVPSYLMNDIFSAFGRSRKMLGAKDGNDDELFVMSVSELRRKLAEMGLAVDGSRETMIQAIQNIEEESTEDDESD